jgi:hypothetical protein
MGVFASQAATAFASSNFWIPYFEYPSGAGGKNGLVIVASNNIDSPAAVHTITTTPSRAVGIAYKYTFTNNVATSALPDLLMYHSVGKDGNIHIYALNLSNTAAVPVPVQIGSLSLSPASKQICSGTAAQTSLSDPTTMFVLIEIAPAGATGCGLGASYEVVHYKDSRSTAPVVTSVTSNLFDPLYEDGELKGMVLFDFLTQSVNLYKNDTFDDPRVLTSGGIAFPVALATIADGKLFGGAAIFLDVTSFQGSSTLYRIESSNLTLTKIADARVTIGGSIVDSANLYYADTTSPATTRIYQVALTGNTPKLLYSGAVGNEASAYQLIQSNGSTLVFQYEFEPETGGVPEPTKAATTLFSVPVGRTSTRPAVIGGPYSGTTVSFLDTLNALSAHGETVYATIRNQSGTGKSAKYKYSSVAIPIAGPYGQKPLENSAFAGDALDNSVGVVLQVKGITETDGGWGGGTMSQFDVDSTKSTTFTTTGGHDFVIPTGHDYYAVILGFFNNGNGAGSLFGLSQTLGPDIGLAMDLERSFLLSISVEKTNVVVY